MGVTWPRELPGYWLSHARTSVINSAECETLDALRRHPDTGAIVCHHGEQPTVRVDGTVECNPQTQVSPEAMFACGTGFEMYPCPNPDACLGGASTPHDAELVTADSTWFRRRLDESGDARGHTCREGHTGVMCARCETHFVLDKARLCSKCPENNAWLYLALVAVATASLFVFLYVDDGNPISDEHINECRGAIVDMLRCRCCRRSKTRRKSRKPTPRPLKPTPSLVAYVRSLIAGVLEQPDKLMLVVAFVQIISQFTTTYNVQWPVSLTGFMQVRAAALGCVALLRRF